MNEPTIVSIEDKPNIKRHSWGCSLRLTPNGCPQEVVLGCFNNPRVYSSVHSHHWKHNRIICNSGKIQVDVFNWGIAEHDLMKGIIQASDFGTVILLPGDDIEIPYDTLHRVCSIERLSMMTEIYTGAGHMIPIDEDIERFIPAGQEWCYREYEPSDFTLLETV
jgi:hypothetical protein